MVEEHVINRIERLEKSSDSMTEHLQRLAVQTGRLAASLEILTESMARQHEQNKKMEDLSNHIATIEERMLVQYEEDKMTRHEHHELPSRITSLESSMSLLKVIGGSILSVAIGMVMVFLFQSGVPLIG